MKTKLLILLGMALLSSPHQASASITYDVDIALGASALFTGTIMTDGATGTLGESDITAWNLNLSDNGLSANLSDINSKVFVLGAGLSATTSALNFDFGVPAFLFFNQGSGLISAAFDFDGLTGNDELVTHVNSSGDLVEGETGSFVIATISNAPLPAALPLFATGLGMMALFHWRRRRTS